MASEEYQDYLECNIPEILPVLPLISTVVFPVSVRSVQIALPRNVRLLHEHAGENQLVALAGLKHPSEPSEYAPSDLRLIGVAARIIQRINLPNKAIQSVFQGVQRIAIEAAVQTDPYLKARVHAIASVENDLEENQRLMREGLQLFEHLVSLDNHYPSELINIVRINIKGPGRFADLLATHLNIPIEDKLVLLETLDVRTRLYRLIEMMNDEVSRIEIERDLGKRTQVELDRAQREHFLRQQLNVIKRELGEEDLLDSDVRQLKQQIETAGLPEQVKAEADREVSRLAMISPASAEYNVIRTYIDWILCLPWNKYSEDSLDIVRAREILDADHFDMEQIKDRIVEFLAVLKLKQDMKGPILCLAGPPGVGKTSLGKTIARAMNRKFVRISVGGIRDEAEIKGHRRTYVGSMPGKIINALKTAGTGNPLIMIDEIDKMGNDFRGDPSSAMLEVLDPEQNSNFVDHYLNVPVDLSHVLFVATANVLDYIPGPLYDRMEVLQLSGYTREEKFQIARQYLIPRQMKANGINENLIEISDGALKNIIKFYTAEAGLRNLERYIGTICRKVAARVVMGEETKHLISESDLEQLIGLPKFDEDLAEKTPEVGIATGLAWTLSGGAVMLIETTKMRGNGGITITGQLGNVMKESVQAALSYVRSRAKDLRIPDEEFKRWDIHIHFPAGAIPKDGPSAGVTIATALTSLFSEKPIRHEIAMTGEITLRGKILPVGGIKEKVLAAYRAGIKKVLMPESNRKDLADIPDEVKSKLEFGFLTEAREAINEAVLNIIRPKQGEVNAKQTVSDLR